ncbi:MAG: FtsQ-type POTRA domain-containing protein [Clostridia bacterium]|nr:FtsQ-type POTRA domain-containing protein [Clostridia bacterium]
MKDAKPKKPKQDIIVEVDVRKLTRFVLLVLMSVLLVLCLFFFMRRFLTVQSFSVSGISEYDLEELVSASGVKRGERLYLLDCDEIEERILEECPYLSSIEVSRKFPNKLLFEVEGKLGLWYIEVAGARYTLDGDLYVIAESKDTEKMTKLELPHLKSAITGELPSFGASQTEVKKTLELISVLRESSLKSRLSAADLSDRTNITLEVDGKYRVLLGDATDFSSKLRVLAEVLEQDQVKNSEGGEINLIAPGAPTFRPESKASEEKDREE